MKYGRSLQELAIELDRQAKVKKDYVATAGAMQMTAVNENFDLVIGNTPFQLNENAHRQLGLQLKIPAPYYERMRAENPGLLMANVNGWFQQSPDTRRMVRTLDGTARAILSDRYRRIDNYEVAQTVLPIISEMQGARIESCELTDDAKRRKSAAFRRQVKSGTAPAQRKYSSLFMGGTASAKKQQKSVPPLVNLARAIKCLDVFGRHDPERAEFYAKKYYEDMSMAREFKAMSATNPTAGGFLIPEVYLDEVIELLYSKTVIKELGARTIPLENGNLNIPRMTSGTRAMWGGEGRKIASTQPAFGNLRLSAKRLEAIVPQTRELLMSTKYSADELFAADLSRRMQLGLDWGALYGTGGEFQPTGIANTPGVEKIDAKKMDAQYAADGRLTADFPVYVKSLVMSKNVDDQALGWAFNSFMEGYLKNIKTTTGDYIYRDEMNAGNFLGMPYKVSNQIPTDSKTGCTEMFFGNWADLMIGDQMGLETYTTLDGTWTDENGVQHNAFEENLTGTRALMYDDIGVRHVESFAYVHNIKVI